MMKSIRFCVLLLVAAVVMWSCGDDYDDTALRNDVNDLKSRVEKLEAWCTTVNGQISSLQGLVSALEANDYVTGVSPVTVDGKTGYTITFTKSEAITIFDGVDGKNGADGTTPVIGVDKFTDGLYYWTVKNGDATATWVKDASGNKIRTTGDIGKTPKLSVAADTDGKVYWQVDGQFLKDAAGKNVPATGDKGAQGEQGAQGAQGDAVFKKDGVKVNADGTVTFTLAGENGATFTLPCVDPIGIFDSFATITTAEAKDIALALNIKDAEYAAIKAEVTNSKGLGVAIATRAAKAPWTVAIKQVPTFNTDGSIKDQAIVTVTPPAMDDPAADTDIALLKVTIVGKDGKEHAETRVLKYGVEVESVTLSKNKLAIVVNEEQTLTATIIPAVASQTVTWSTSDATIATVDAATGKVKGLKAGKVTITAASTANSEKKTACEVTVSTVAVTKIILSDITVQLGKKQILTATIEPATATVKTVTWSSDKPEIAKVDATTGEVEGKAEGDATITATAIDGSGITGTCKVKVTKEKTIVWAVGNLVADGVNGAKIGAPTDNGLYFQFGSLIGWIDSDTSDPTIAVKPAAFNGNEGWTETGKIWQGTEGTVPFTVTGSGSADEKAGIGDPCRYYLKGTWRLPTKDEYEKLFDKNGYPSTGPWKWGNSSATNNMLNLTFPASGFRSSSDGSLDRVGTYGHYWSASPISASYGSFLYFYDTFLNPDSEYNRVYGMPVRCVQEN